MYTRPTFAVSLLLIWLSGCRSINETNVCFPEIDNAPSLELSYLSPHTPELCNEVLHDIETLLTHTSFLFDKINFLMDSTQGFININQNKIIKTFSIAAVVFLPPTLVASIYGMNFHWMPELDKDWGYPFALCLMGASALSTYLFFKWKKWL